MAQFDDFGTDCIREMEHVIAAQAEVLTAFPNLLKMPGAAHEFWTTVDVAGADLYFFDAAGVALPYELVAINTVATTGELYVRETLSNIANNYIYMLWSGSDNLGNTPSDTWSGSYHLVYHGQQGAGNWTDSTANGYTGTNTGVAAGVGKIGVCGDFEASELDVVANATAWNNMGANQALSWFAWLKRESTGALMAIVMKQGAGTTFIGTGWFFQASNIPVLVLRSAATQYKYVTGGTNTSTNMQCMCVTYNGGGLLAGLMYYTNGLDVSAGRIESGVLGAIGSTVKFEVGKATGFAGAYFDGLIDEVRIATVARSVNWVAAEYSNTNDPASWSTLTTVPNITNFAPVVGPAGTAFVCTCTGALAAQGAGSQTFGGVAGGITAWGWVQVTGTVPAGAGNVEIRLTNNDNHYDIWAGGWTYPGGPTPITTMIEDSNISIFIGIRV